MRYTKNDLSYDRATLDHEAMLVTAAVAYGRLLRSIDQYTGGMHEINSSVTALHLSAERLKEDADLLVIVAETYATLKGSLDRPELVITNKLTSTNQ